MLHAMTCMLCIFYNVITSFLVLQVQAEYSKSDQLGYDIKIEIKLIEFWTVDPVSDYYLLPVVSAQYFFVPCTLREMVWFRRHRNNPNYYIQSNFNVSNIFGTMEICSSHG